MPEQLGLHESGGEELQYRRGVHLAGCGPGQPDHQVHGEIQLRQLRSGSVSGADSLKAFASRPGIHATPTVAGVEPLTPDQIHSWRKRGFAFVSGLFERGLIEELRIDALQAFPAPGSDAARGARDFGSGGRLVFPSRSDAFNAVTLHPTLLAAVAQLLAVDVPDLRLTQSDLWPKYGQTGAPAARDNDDQRMHVDYPNHTLAHPSPWDRPDAVELIVYLDRVEDCGGATALVAREGDDDPAYRWPIVDSPGIGDLDWINDRTTAEADFAGRRPALADWRAGLYEREQQVHYAPGDVLLYRHDLWHRGTPLVPGRLRLAQNITYRKASAEWIATLHTGWSWSAYHSSKYLEKLIATATVDQRTVLGFPAPGSKYWCDETLAAVEARYGVHGIDMAPYLSGSERTIGSPE
ncbi:MAG: phytanoyl-CoA dioxygenase family protein [Pseudomonadales bacterium]